MVDYSVPSPEVAGRCLATALTRLAARQAVYLHCWGGRGRAGTMGALLLAVLYPELGAAAALALVARGCQLRTEDPHAASPETAAQVEFVLDFAEQMARHRNVVDAAVRSKL